MLPTSFLSSYKSIVIALTIKDETLKVKDVITMILDDEEFKEINGDNKDGAFVANSNRNRSNLGGNNSINTSSSRI